MNEMSLKRFIPKRVSPIREDRPGTVTAMPSPAYIGHVHILSDENYDEMVDFYVKVMNGEIVARSAGPGPGPQANLTFISYDDSDHRVVIIRLPGGGKKPGDRVGVDFCAFGYRSLGEVLYVYKRMKEWGYPPERVLNHGNSTSFYYRDPDGNQVETLVENYTPLETKVYKKNYQFTEEFGPMPEGNFDPDKMVALYEAGVPDEVLLDREQVKALKAEGKL